MFFFCSKIWIAPFASFMAICRCNLVLTVSFFSMFLFDGTNAASHYAEHLT